MKSKRSIIIEIIAFLLILLFLYTGLSKMLDPNFKRQLTESPWLIVSSNAHILVTALPIAEIIIALLLVFPATRFIGLISSAAIMGIFTIYIGTLLISDSKLPCSCGGVLSTMNWKQHFFFNTSYFIISILGIYLHRNKYTTKLSSPPQEKIVTI